MTGRAARPGHARWWWVLPALACAIDVSAADMRLHIMDADGHPVPDAVVLIRSASRATVAAPATRDVVVTDMSLVPRVSVLRAGDRVRFVNRDRVRHHVYSFSPAQKLNLSLQPGETSGPVAFGRAGVVTIGCNIHDGMTGYVYVADTPWFGRTDTDGRVQLSGLPKGLVTVRVWHPHMAEPEAHTAREISLIDEATSFVTWRLLLAAPVDGARAPHIHGHTR